MRLIYHPEAEAELIEAAQFNERRAAGLGRVSGGSRWAVHTIQEAPERWRIIEEDVRRFLMPRFPYSIYYRVLRDHIRILAFKHHSRHPEYWRGRISE